MNCFQSGCKNIPSLYCSCSNDIEYCCSLHMVNHLNKPSVNKHKFYSSLKNLDPNLKSPFIEKLKQLLFELNSKKTQIFKIASDFNILVIECVKRIDKIINYNRRLLKESIISNQINIRVSNKKIYKNNNLSLEMLQLNIKEQSKNMILGKIMKNIKTFQNFLKKSQNELIKPDNSKFLCYFISGTKSLVKFNTKNNVYIKKYINEIEPVGRRASIYYLNDGNIFCYGGQTVPTTFYINDKSLSVTRLPNGRVRHSIRPAFHNSRIYCFGGWSDYCLISADYFDINTRTWTEIAPLSSSQSDTSPIKVKDQIIITGFRNFLQSYDTNLNTYRDLNSGIQIDAFNILLKYKEMIYLLCRKIYFTKKTKINKWKSDPSKTVAFNMSSSVPVIRGSRAYFIDEDYNIFMFDFNDLSFKLVTNGRI